MREFIELDKSTLFNPLQKVFGIVDRKNTMSILANVLLEKNDGKLNLISTDTEIQVSTEVADVEVVGDQAITINAKKLSDILKSFKDNENLTLELDEESESMMNLKCGRSRFQLQTLPAEDFPKLELDEEDLQIFTLTQREFKSLLKQTQYAIGVQDIRYYLNGLLLSVNKHKIVAVSTDGHRMAYASKTINEELPTRDVIVPRKTILELIRLLPDGGNDIDIGISKSQIRFNFNDITIVSKIIDARFPDYNAVIPNEFTKAFMVDRNEIITAIQRVSIVSADKTCGVLFSLSAGNLSLTAQNTEQEEAKEDISIQYNGEELEIGFNVQYLLDALTNINSSNVIFRFIDENSSGLITGGEYVANEENLCEMPVESNGDSSENDFDADGDFVSKAYYKYVVMPMRI